MKLFFMMFCLSLFNVDMQGQDIIYTLPHGGGSTVPSSTGTKLDYVIGQYFYGNEQQISTGLLQWVIQVNDISTSTTDVLPDDALMKVYPNPAMSYVTIDFNVNNIEETTWVVELYDALGQVVLQRTWFIQTGNNYLYLDVRDLPRANYFIKVMDSKSKLLKTYKLIKQ